MNSDQKRIGTLLLYVGILISLVVTVVNVFILSFGFINYLLTPSSFTWHDYYYGVLETLPASVAFFIVGFATLVVLSRKARSFEETDNTSGVWYSLSQAVIMLVLGVSLGAVIISFGILLEGILSGDVEFAFLLKLLVVVLVGSAVFYYYRRVLRRLWENKKQTERMFVASLIVIAVSLVGASIALLDPVHRSALNTTFDTLDHLKSTRNAVTNYADEEKALPATFNEIDKRFRYFPHSDSLEGFSYTKINARSYTLCASFPILPRNTTLKGYPYTEFPISEIGEQCFTFSVSL